jgi:PE family
MSFLFAVPEYVASAASDLADIGSALTAANTSAFPVITALLPAGADEISAAIAGAFGAHAGQYRALSARVAQFHDEFVRAMSGTASSYAGAEAANLTPLQQLEQSMIGFNGNLVDGELGFNKSLVTNELAMEQSIFHTDSALNGVLNRTFNAGNLLVGTGEQMLNGLLGAQVPVNFTASLLTGTGQQVFNGGQISGLVGAFDQNLVATGDLIGLSGAGPALSPDLRGIESNQIAFNTNLVNSELGFNNSLLNSEIGFEQNMFHSDSALNGALNRGYNVVNLLVGTGEQGVNALLGPQVPTGLWGSLLTGTGQQPFNGGQIGGIEGMLGQSLASVADLAGLLTG